MPIKSTKINANKICKETIPKQSRKTHYITSLTLNNNRQHQIVTNPYVQSIIHPNQKSIHHEQLLNQPIVPWNPDPTSKEHTLPTTHQTTTSKTYSNCHRKIILTKEGSILTNGSNNIITKEPESTINNTTIPIPQSKPSIPIKTHRKYPIELTTRPPDATTHKK